MKNFQISFQDYQNAQQLHAGKSYWVMLIIILLIVGSFLIGRDLVSPEKKIQTFTILLLVFSSGLVIVLFPIALKWKFKKYYDSQKSLQETIQLTFDDQKLSWHSESGEYHCLWSDLYKWNKNNKVIILYEGKNLIRIVPCHAFEDGDELNKFERYASHIPTNPT